VLVGCRLVQRVGLETLEKQAASPPVRQVPELADDCSHVEDNDARPRLVAISPDAKTAYGWTEQEPATIGEARTAA